MAAAELAKDFAPERLEEIRAVFQELDTDGNGTISLEELALAMERLGGKAVSNREVVETMKSADLNADNVVDWDEFVTMIHKSEVQGEDASHLYKLYVEQKRVFIEGKGGSQHSYTEEERVSFANHINHVLGRDPDCESLLPIDPESEQLFSAVSNGVLLAKLINDSAPNTIDERVLVKKVNMNRFEMLQNLNLVINSAKGVGCKITNIRPEDITEGKPHLILGLVWQVVKVGLVADINLQAHPELVRLLREGEEMADLLKLSPEELLIRWVNYHLQQGGSDRRISNFSGDIKDSVVYTILLHQISHGSCSKDALAIEDVRARAEAVLENADTLDCRKFVSANDIVKGNSKLNLAFVANLFNNHPALEALTERELAAYADMMEFDEEGTREERAFRFWLQGLGLEVNNLFEDVKDGLLLCRALEIIQPGCIDWSKVNMQPRMIFHKNANCSYAVEVGGSLKFSTVNIGGSDIAQGEKKLILALVWQMMRLHIINLLKKFGDGGEVDERKMIDWANRKVSSAGKSSKMVDFSDQTLSSGRFLLDLCDAVCPGIVNYEIVTSGASSEDQEQNAKYAISVARAIGATLYCLWEDLKEVNKRMVLTFVGSLMLFDKTGAGPSVAPGAGGSSSS